MRKLLALFALAVATVASPAAAAGQDITGTWRISFESEGVVMSQRLTLDQEGTDFVGTLVALPSEEQGDTFEPLPVEIYDGRAIGRVFSFTIVLDFSGNLVQRLYTGTFDGDAMQGQLHPGFGPSIAFTGKREG